VKLERFDHLVLTVRSIAATSAVYRDVLGMEVVTFGEGRIALGFGIQKINFHEVGREGRLMAARPAPWDSLGVRPDGTTFSRPGRLTIAFEKRDGRGLARHTHFSLSPAPA